MNIRLLAYRALAELGNRHTDELIDDYLKKYSLSDIDRRFFAQLVVGVVEDRILLDYYIDTLSRVPVGEVVRNILRLGFYQAVRLNVPDYAAVNESLKLADELNEPQAKGYINALLRTFLRRKKTVPMPKERDKYLSVYYAHPLWLVRYWLEMLGEERTEALLAAGCKKPPLTIRINSSLVNRDEYLIRLADAGVEAFAAGRSACGIGIKSLGGLKISELPGYDEGHFIVQDESSQIAIEARPPRKGDYAIDVCCSPGGKTTHIAEYAAKVSAFDISRSRLGVAMQNILRMGFAEKVQFAVVDATMGVKELNDSADYVLVDAPCSALGTIRRNPDIRHNRIRSDIAKNAKTQRIVLKRASQYVKAGGTLIYSTCTVTSEENEDQVRRFLQKNQDFSLVREELLLPSEGDTDGFYYAVMVRK